MLIGRRLRSDNQKSVKSSLKSQPLSMPVYRDILFINLGCFGFSCTSIVLPIFIEFIILRVRMLLDVAIFRAFCSFYSLNFISNEGVLQNPFTNNVFLLLRPALFSSSCLSLYLCQAWKSISFLLSGLLFLIWKLRRFLLPSWSDRLRLSSQTSSSFATVFYFSLLDPKLWICCEGFRSQDTMVLRWR